MPDDRQKGGILFFMQYAGYCIYKHDGIILIICISDTKNQGVAINFIIIIELNVNEAKRPEQTYNMLYDVRIFLFYFSSYK